MKKRKKKTRDKNPCAGCEWGYELNEQQVYCPLPRCVNHDKEKEDCRGSPGSEGAICPGAAETETTAEADSQRVGR